MANIQPCRNQLMNSTETSTSLGHLASPKVMEGAALVSAKEQLDSLGLGHVVCVCGACHLQQNLRATVPQSRNERARAQGESSAKAGALPPAGLHRQGGKREPPSSVRSWAVSSLLPSRGSARSRRWRPPAPPPQPGLVSCAGSSVRSATEAPVTRCRAGPPDARSAAAAHTRSAAASAARSSRPLLKPYAV